MADAWSGVSGLNGRAPPGLGPLPLPDSGALLHTAHTPETSAVFIYYFAQLHQPFETADARVDRMLGDFDAWAGAAYRHGEELRARVGVGGKHSLIAKTVSLDVGRPVRTPNQTTIPLAWRATGPAVLFPEMNADLTVARLGPDMTQLGFSGSYDPPLGLVGQKMDEALLHRIAEASVKSFVDRITTAVEDDQRVPAD